MSTGHTHKTARLPRITEMAHQLLAERVKAGDTVIDATAGNGYDTLFLAELVGDTGRVHAYDVQNSAIQATESRLSSAGYSDRVELHHASHTAIAESDEPIQAAIFNLGYLPGSDKHIITQADSTLEAVQAALSRLISGGMVLLVVYVGHAGGEQEAEALECYMRTLSTRDYLVLKYEYINPDNRPPYILAVEKK
ncbi:class I SAM-dependent methyltransferase [Aneurinibacillus aneurinilyticus]|uniref:Putative rRNA methylase n=1 Tax=Aneurinibacillus aneurinilyticus ATCC 12856 TaxID=649747 RepID=U1WI95_ANEAE|nr:class I SAM-dependent methyltransferase [Aneurinibacillus aneurinilyticus]ERI08279.1 putative rRNA methylase [Aneurinibacillus aneurinilyticus ATCC 12856]MED0705695.1 class I SAM-dependent methyltransferase [Aneurinibacillus aneurinilyticus]MED0725836.1 class I SAM-dependent methyltransferase [Aneurinibacillus aneurinilyticus]MED0732183.1 class I SAM-dependent methyltransferase [Aneurinibacillus aneurinilyticus]MED0740731.1 class I SAM-dependent methyltransferase [Aneurinibacillus aneurinil